MAGACGALGLASCGEPPAPPPPAGDTEIRDFDPNNPPEMIDLGENAIEATEPGFEDAPSPSGDTPDDDTGG